MEASLCTSQHQQMAQMEAYLSSVAEESVEVVAA